MLPVNYTKHVVIIVYDNVMVSIVGMKEWKGTLISNGNLGGKLFDPWGKIGNLSRTFFKIFPADLSNLIQWQDKVCRLSPCFEILRCRRERPTESRERSDVVCSVL